MFHAPLGLISGAAQLKWLSMLQTGVERLKGCPRECAMSRKRLTAVQAQGRGREVSCLSRLACNFIIAFRCMFPAVAFALAINRRLIAHVPPLPACPLVSCSVYACGELSFILCQLRGQRKSPWQGRRTLRDGWGEGGETKLRFN